MTRSSAGGDWTRGMTARTVRPNPHVSRSAAMSVAMSANSESQTCQACGACCSYSRDWPRFTTEDDADLDLIPPSLVDAGLAGMRCNGDRCAALVGDVGLATSCSIYNVRPDVCRACEPGDDACQIARKRFGLPSLSPRNLTGP